MSAQSLLDVYLSDHFAGATGGLELIDRIAASHPGNRELSKIASEIADERRTLQQVMAAVNVQPPALKSAIAWVGEKVARLKLNDRLFGRSPLSSVLELEGMITAVSGKLQLWRALSKLASKDQRLEKFDFDQLAVLAESQRERLEREHAAAVARALEAPPATPSGA
jgi:hypothetical protein